MKNYLYYDPFASFVLVFKASDSMSARSIVESAISFRDLPYDSEYLTCIKTIISIIQ